MNKSCVGRLCNMSRASYECKGTVGCGSNLVDVFVPREVLGNMNSQIVS